MCHEGMPAATAAASSCIGLVGEIGAVWAGRGRADDDAAAAIEASSMSTCAVTAGADFGTATAGFIGAGLLAAGFFAGDLCAAGFFAADGFAIGWLYVVVMMALTETSFIAGLVTLVFYGLAPLALFLWLMGTPERRRRQRSRDQPDE